MTKPVLVLGGTGMLGSAVAAVLDDIGIPVTATARNLDDVRDCDKAGFRVFDASQDDLGKLLHGYGPGDVVVNCIGVIKPYIRDDDADLRRRAIMINSVFPHDLGLRSTSAGFRLIQIATDCVYSGEKGGYSELDTHDARDVYGRTKSLGEVPGVNVLHLRCSVIGPEAKGKTSLLEWVLSHRDGTSLSGYTDHLWNGITGQAFARIVAGIVSSNNPLSGTAHVVPADTVSKYSLSRIILSAYGRGQVSVLATETGDSLDRTLATQRPDVNARLWNDAGYSTIPTIDSLVHDLVRPQENGEQS